MLARSVPPEICAQLYVGDYFAQTLCLSAREHAALGPLLLHVWLKGPVKRWRFAAVTGLTGKDWRTMRQAVLPHYKTALANIDRWKKAIRAHDGKRLPAQEWHIVRTIVLARDANACIYCGGARKLHVDHIIPVSRGGSNAFDNLAASCGSCNQSKGRKLLTEWLVSSPKKRARPGIAPRPRHASD